MAPKRTKINTTHYRKQFKSFSTAILEAVNCCPALSKFLGVSADTPQNQISIESVYKKIVELAQEHMPNITKRENMLWEFQISANKVSIKTNDYISFGWGIKSDRVESDDNTTFQNIYNFRITLFGDYSEDVINNLRNNGWLTEEDLKGEE